MAWREGGEDEGEGGAEDEGSEAGKGGGVGEDVMESKGRRADE